MKAEDIQVGKTYEVKVGTRTIAVRVRSITPREEYKDDGSLRRTVYTYETEDAAGKVHVVRSPSYFLSEIFRKPVANDLVTLVKAGKGLAAGTLYRVKSVGPKNAVVLSGGKEHKVPLSDLRVEGAKHHRCTCLMPEPKPQQFTTVCLKCGGEVGEGEQSPDPTKPKSGGSGTTRSTNGSVPSGKRPTTSTTPPPGGPASEPKSVKDSVTAPSAPVSGSDEPSTERAKMTVEQMNEKSAEWCEAALGAGYDENNPPPVGWEPETAEVFVEQTALPRERDRVDYTFNPLRDVLFEALEDCEDAQNELIKRAREKGWSLEECHAAASWYEVAEMVEREKPAVRSALPARKGEQWVEADMASVELGPERECSAMSMDHLQNPSVPKRPKPSPPAPTTFSQRLGREECKDDSPHVIVEARAGTGKTTTLVEGLKPLLGIEPTITPSPQQKAVWDAIALSKGKVKSICFVAFNKSISQELQSRVPAGVCAMTMHSMGFNAVKQAFGRGLKVESGRVQNILSELMEEDIRDLRRKKFDVLKGVEDLVGLCKMNLVYGGDADGFEGLDRLVSHYDLEIAECHKDEVYSLVPQVLERCKDVKADNEIDFNDMVWLPVALDLKMTKYDLLLVDEAQDLNRCQQSLAKKAGRRLILVGDPKQAIYGFAGADSESMDRMYRELDERHPLDFVNKYGAGTDGRPMQRGCVRLPLTVTRRCGKAIVEEARKIVPDFEAFEGNGPGKVSSAKYPGGKTKGVKLTPEEEALNPDYTSQVRDGDFVLCRCNAPLVSQCFRFLKAGKKASIQGRDIGKGLTKLLDSFKAQDVPELVKGLSDWLHAEQRKENAKRNPSESKLINLEDKHDCLMAFTDGAKTVQEVKSKIESVFADEEPGKPKTGIRLSSIHRAKGLEAKRVFFLMPEGALCPHPMAKSAWQVEQEHHLKYVGVTRAIEELVYVT